MTSSQDKRHPFRPPILIRWTDRETDVREDVPDVWPPNAVTPRKSLQSSVSVDGLSIVVTRKPIKNVYLRVDQATGLLRMSVPLRLPDAEVTRFVRDHRRWIDRRMQDLARNPPAAEPNYVTGEQHRLLGRLLTLRTQDRAGRSMVKLDGTDLVLGINSDSSLADRKAAINRWYREQLAQVIPELIATWEPIMSVSVAEWRIRQMTTRWGSCNMRARRIWLNLELVKFPPECLEYVVVHEMNHLLERGHTPRFHALMDNWLPTWRNTRKLLATRKMDID